MIAVIKQTIFTLLVLATLCAVYISAPVPLFAEGVNDDAMILIDGNSSNRFQTISGIKGFNDTGNGVSTEEFLANVYRMAIIAGAVIAVIKLILAGVQYVLSGVVTDKAKAKKDIRSALIGLLIILAAVTLLTQINPQITNMPNLESISNKISSATEEFVTSPQKQRISIMCDAANGGCSTDTCEQKVFNVLGLVVPGSAYVNNSFSCVLWCSWYNGELVDRVANLPDSGKCIYPNDPETYQIAQERALEKLAEEGVVAEVVTFKDPTSTQWFQGDKLTPQLLLINSDRILGVYERNLGAGGGLDRYEQVEKDIIERTCIENGGTETRVSTYNTANSVARHYCIQ